MLSENLKIAAQFRNPSSESEFRSHCGSLNGHHLDADVGALGEVRATTRRFAASDVLLLDIDPRDAEQFAQLGAVLREFPDKPVIATAPEPSVQDIRRMLHLGVVDVLPQPLGEDDLAAALRQAMRAQVMAGRDALPPRGRTVAFLKSAGGVGATTLAVQSGCILAEAPKRQAAQPVCLLDLDIQQGSAGLHLDLPPCDQLLDLAGTPDRIDDALLEGLLTHHQSGLGVLAAPPRTVPLDTLDPALVSAVIETAARSKAYVLLDLPSAWVDWKLEALQMADVVLLVTQLTVPGIRHARQQLETLAEQGLADLPVSVVINRYDRRLGGSVGISRAETALDRPIRFRVRNDYATVSEAINQGVALRTLKRRSKIEKSVRKLVDTAIRGAPVTGARAEPKLRMGAPNMLEQI